MTRQALDKLNENQLTYLKDLSTIISKYKMHRQQYPDATGFKETLDRTVGRLRGFLECLCQMGIITGTEAKLLCSFFYSEDRNRRKEEE